MTAAFATSTAVLPRVSVFLSVEEQQSIAQQAAHRLLMSTSAFLQTRLAKRRPIPRMEVMAYMTFCLPSTLVLSTRRMCWNSSPATSDCTGRHQTGLVRTQQTVRQR